MLNLENLQTLNVKNMQNHEFVKHLMREHNPIYSNHMARKGG